MKHEHAALRAIKTAVRRGAWRADPHLFRQLAKRHIALTDVSAALAAARKIEPHDMRPLNAGGESWRVYGFDLDGRMLGVGVELVGDSAGDFVVVLTAFET